MLRKTLIGAVVVFILFLVYIATRTPSHEKDGEMFSQKTPTAAVRVQEITLHNVRNWNYTDTETTSREWIDAVTIKPEDIKTIWFGFSGFSKFKAAGHTFLSFELQSGEVYTLSVEARREKGETYSAFKGLFNKYELLYGWGTERDYVGVRVHRAKQPVEIYPLQLTQEEAAAVFIAVADETRRVAEKPRFYNTITSNCTNELVNAVNQRYPGRIRYNIAHNLPGLSIGYLQKIGFLQEVPRFVIPTDSSLLLEGASSSTKDFSAVLRDILAQ